MPRIRVRVLLCEPRRNRVHLCISLRDTNARSESTDHTQLMATSIRGLRLRGSVVIDRKRRPETVLRGDWKAKGCRHDADDRADLTAEVYRSSDYRGARRELRSPQRMADEDDARSGFLFVGRETAAQFGIYSKQGKQVPADDFAIEMRSALDASEGDGGVVISDQVIEAVVLDPPVKEVR